MKNINLAKYFSTAQMSAQNLTNGGIAYLFTGYLLKVVYLVPLLLLWRTLSGKGVDVGMTLPQMLTYTYLGAILSDILVVQTPASNWFYEGLFISLYQRPSGILSDIVSQTAGKWVPQLLFYSLPMMAAAPLFGVNLMPLSFWFLPSLILCVSLGFATDFLFACLTIRLQNSSWLVYVIRTAIVSLLSGSVIPFSIFPGRIGDVFQYLPLGSLAGAPLSIFTGISGPFPLIPVQLFWNMVLWPAAILVFGKAQERMVSYGG